MQSSLVFILIVQTIAVMTLPNVQMTDSQLEQLLNNKALMQQHLKCALGEGPCDFVGRRLRTLAPLVLRGSCPQCSPTETRQIRRTIVHIQRNYPWEWSRIIRQHG